MKFIKCPRFGEIFVNSVMSRIKNSKGEIYLRKFSCKRFLQRETGNINVQKGVFLTQLHASNSKLQEAGLN